jgi:lipoprotein-anchoring transpeptidase ErfK/SrfK
MSRLFAVALVVGLALSAARAAEAPARARSPVSADSIEAARANGGDDTDPSLIAKAEILLDRAHVSPGEIDGSDGDNYRSAVRALQQVRGLAVSGKLDAGAWSALTEDHSAVLKTYAISDADVAGPFTKAIPARLVEMARLPGLSYTSAVAELAEKFHMSQDLMRKLNPHADFSRKGTEIAVADVEEMRLAPGRRSIEAVPPKGGDGPTAATIVIDKPGRNLRAYDQDGKFLAFYPVTVGSEEKPAPSGVFNVRGVDWNPEYHYDPKFAWKEVKTRRKLTIGPGPNNPVGLVWIDLTAPSYGLHGTPSPAAIGKTESHGCVRLTNWDAANLAAMARPGTVVRFEDADSPVVATLPIDAATESQSARPAP